MLYAHRLHTTSFQHGVRGDTACLGLQCPGPPSPAALAGVQATAAATLLLLLSAARSRLQGAGGGGAASEQRGDSSRGPARGGLPRGRAASQQEPSRRWRREPADLADADVDPEVAEPERRNPQVQRLIDLEPAGSGGSPSVRRWVTALVLPMKATAS